MSKRLVLFCVISFLSTLSLGAQVPSSGDTTAARAEVAHRCVNETGAPCETAKEYKRAFTDGELGSTSVTKSDFTARFKKKMRRAAVRQGLIPPPASSSRPVARGKYKYGSWGDLWNAFTNALDCVAPGAESACKEDISTVKHLKKPSKVVLGCGGVAVMSYLSAGTGGAVAAAVTGGSLCSWSLALEAW